VFLPSF
jgi:hypothetical protein